MTPIDAGHSSRQGRHRAGADRVPVGRDENGGSALWPGYAGGRARLGFRARSLGGSKQEDALLAVVVIPCLNEADNLGDTVGSLGFGPGYSGPHALVLVDNGSTDATRPLMDAFAEQMAPGTVVVLSEPERGFVPARRAGTEAAAALAARRSIGEDGVLVVQADADTRYVPEYCSVMTAAAESGRAGELYEARNVVSTMAGDACAGFDALAASVDEASSSAFGDPSFDVVVDDKIAAFRLGDYRRWGGHVREWDNEGDEMFAETTRLFLRARLVGARRVLVERAAAETSRRRILADPAVAFSTAGYPRGHGWIERFRSTYRGATELRAFGLPASRPQLSEAVEERKRHLLAMFRLLPALVERHVGGDADPARSLILDGVCLPDSHAVGRRPSLLLEAALAIPDRRVRRARDCL